MRKHARLLVLAAVVAAPFAQATVVEPGWTETTNWRSDGGGHTGLAWAPDASDRLFVIEKSGRVRVLTGALTSGGAGTWSTFATETVHTNNECGLIGMAFDPDFATNHYVYFFITAPGGSEQQIVRYNAAGATGTERTVVVQDLPTIGENHDGGAIGFGRDGKLYWAIGDLGNGTGINDNLTSLAAKVGRANRDGSLPADNPFDDGHGPNNDFIWARGFRNPFTMTFQPGTHDLWLNVVGTSYEQVFVVNRGDHAGYNQYENNQPDGYITPKIVYRTNGTDVRNLAASGASRSNNIATFTTSTAHRFRVGGNVNIEGVTNASFDMENAFIASVPSASTFTVVQPGPDASSGGGTVETLEQGGCLTGGTFYDSNAAPAAFRGNFFYGDCNSGRINRATLSGTQVTSTRYFVEGSPGQVDVALGPDGALYYLGSFGAGIRRVAPTPAGQGIVVWNQHLRLDEGGRAVTKVSLALAPAGEVTVGIARSSGDTDVDVESGGTLVFTPANWNRPQTVTFAAADDADASDDLATLDVSSPGLATVTIEATVLDLLELPQPDHIFADGFED